MSGTWYTGVVTPIVETVGSIGQLLYPSISMAGVNYLEQVVNQSINVGGIGGGGMATNVITSVAQGFFDSFKFAAWDNIKKNNGL